MSGLAWVLCLGFNSPVHFMSVSCVVLKHSSNQLWLLLCGMYGSRSGGNECCERELHKLKSALCRQETHSIALAICSSRGLAHSTASGEHPGAQLRSRLMASW